MKKNTAAKSTAVAAEPVVNASVAPSEPTSNGAPVLTPELIAAIRAAKSVDEGVKLLRPDVKTRAKADATYTLKTECAEPLPQKGGACLKVIAAAVQLDRPFKLADITNALPDVKSAPYWTRRLVKTGHLAEVNE